MHSDTFDLRARVQQVGNLCCCCCLLLSADTAVPVLQMRCGARSFYLNWTIELAGVPCRVRTYTTEGRTGDQEEVPTHERLLCKEQERRADTGELCTGDCTVHPLSSGMRACSSFLAIAAWVATCASCLQCAPGCLQLQALSDADGSSVLHSQSCTAISSDSSTPALSLLPASLNASWSAAPTTSPQLPVLDLCNQVQSVWLMQGSLGIGGGLLLL